jgi:hypothetical protein
MTHLTEKIWTLFEDCFVESNYSDHSDVLRLNRSGEYTSISEVSPGVCLIIDGQGCKGPERLSCEIGLIQDIRLSRKLGDALNLIPESETFESLIKGSSY